ncbi:unnamed protein product, partial [Mesorhabditis spiculigera]
MLAIASSSLFIYSDLWLAQFFPYFKSAILMGLNLELLASDGDYFAEGTESLPFVHAWSLAVEMQFYLVAPLLSCTHSGLYNISTVHRKSRPPEFGAVYYPDLYGCVFGDFLVFRIDWSRFRLNYIATISYALYLVHYPVLKYAQYLQPFHFERVPVSVIALPFTILISMVFHHLYEKPMLRETKTQVFKHMLLLFAILLFFSLKWEVVVKSECEQNALVDANKKFMKGYFPASGGKWMKDDFSKYSGTFGHYVYQENKGNLSVVIVGNSWSSQQKYIVRKYLPPNMTSSMESFAIPRHSVVFHDSGAYTKVFWEKMDKTKPKIVFILLRYNEKVHDFLPYRPGNDTILNNYQQAVDRFAKFADHIFVSSHQPFFCEAELSKNDFLARYIRRLESGKDLKDFNAPYNATDFASNPVRVRLKVLLSRCKKCHLVDLESPFIALIAPTRKFREDIAFIRALAIISVLGYHFWPDIFGLGFIGVDIFFVLSGYLIMTILAQDKSGPRAKLLVISCLFVYSGVWLAQFFPYFLSVTTMQLNLKLYASDGDYFAEVVPLVALPLTFVISMLFHHLYEKPMLHEKKMTVLKHITVLFVILLIVAFKWKLIFKTECAQSAIVQANRRFVGGGYFVGGGKAQNDIFKASGSFGHFVWGIVRKFLPGNITSSCESYARAENSMIFHDAQNLTLALWRELDLKQPKIVFILLRYNYYRGDLKPFLGEKNDTVLAYYQQAVDRLSIFADHIFVSSHQPFFCEDEYRRNNFLNRFMAALERGQDMTKLHMPYNEAEFAAHPVRVRLKIVLSRCKKCHFLDLESPFIALTSTTRKFREDIAFIRALAIISVLGYHFWPDVFGLGFIGVDIFFVLSGYLMMTILAADNSGPAEKLLNFYHKRIKRIMPLYYMVLLGIVISCGFVYSGVWLAQYFPYFMSVITMQLNLKLYASDGDYFAESTENLPFLHTWSLAVEMQFYLMAPCIYYLIRLKVAGRAIGVLFSGAILLASFYFQWAATPITAFYHPFARIWQFLAGMLASHFSEGDLKLRISDRLVDSATIALLIPIFGIFLPDAIASDGLQDLAPFVVPAMVAIFLMVSSYSDRLDWARFRLNYTAAISYALYLVHYPVLKYTQHLQPAYFESIPVWVIALPVTIVLSIAVHHLYEKPMLREAPKVVFKHMAILFGILFIVAIAWKPIFNTGSNDPKISNVQSVAVEPAKTLLDPKAAVEANRVFLKTYYPALGDEVNDAFKGAFSHYTWPGNKGKLSVVVVGNSWACQQQYIVRKYLPTSMTSSLDVYTASGSSIVFQRLKHRTDLFWADMEKKRPKIIFVLLRYTYQWGDWAPYQPGNDTVLNYYQQAVDRLSEFAEHIFISSHQPFICPIAGKDNNILSRFIAALENGKDLTKLNMPYNAKKFAEDPVRIRVKLLFERCKKCHLLDMDSPFINVEKNWVQVYDTKTNLAYFDNSCHFTKTGLETIEPQFEKAIRAALPEYFP